MVHESLSEIYVWAQGQLNQPILLGYWLYRVNGQIPGSLFILVRQPGAKLAEAEIKIDYAPNQETLYRANFEFLPFAQNPKVVPYLNTLRLRFGSQQAVIHWLKTGQILR